MRYDPAQKEATRKRMLEAAHRLFRRQGFAGAGVDGLASEAGVTSGAFYKHFGSKAEAFRTSVEIGVGEFRAAVEQFQEQYGGAWLAQFASFYLGEKRCAELGELRAAKPQHGSGSCRYGYAGGISTRIAEGTQGFCRGFGGQGKPRGGPAGMERYRLVDRWGHAGEGGAGPRACR